jgi:hypothetical protein
VPAPPKTEVKKVPWWQFWAKAAEVKSAPPATPPDARSWPEQLKHLSDLARKRFDELEAGGAGAAEYAVKLIIIFALQTIVVPLLIVWVLMRCARLLFEWDRSRQVEQAG